MCDVNSTKSTEKRVKEKIYCDQKNTVVTFTIKTSDDTRTSSILTIFHESTQFSMGFPLMVKVSRSPLQKK